MTPADRYDQMKSFVIVFSEQFLRVRGLKPESMPAAQIQKAEATSRRLARIGVEQAFNDCMEMLQALDRTQIDQLNERLRALSLPNLAGFQRSFSRKYAAVVRRGKIRTETEFHLMRNVVDAPQVSETERGTIEAMLREFEFRKKRT